MNPSITTERALRVAFWQAHPRIARNFVNGIKRPVLARQNQQPAVTRMAWVDFVDAMQKSGAITERLADKATL